ncbi:nicastrin isoform X2 [Frankliniella occidentalis]|uniref:Nicastrin n=1 Tax=Frankliniella occidentalis TaxID=133901 RepID=A0A6J1STX2_FRAOC|nr:nicastrin isoform X2 [Frankliniella occidentalis]
MYSQYISVLIFIFSSLLSNCNVNSQRLKESMYENIDGSYACFRRLNGTHQFGCTSARSGNVGVVHIIENQSDVDWLVKDALAPPYVAVVQPAMFSKSLLLSLQTSEKVNGVAVINNGFVERPESFTHEDSCPNRYSGLSLRLGQTCGIQEQSVWNPSGTSILLMDWKFPIFYVTDQSQIDHLYNCYRKHNVVTHPADQLDRALCALELRSHMFASGNSKKCIQRNSYKTLFSQMSFCDPLGGRNVWQTLLPRSTKKEFSLRTEKQMDSNGSIAVLAARMDSNSMFDGLVPASVGAVTSIVTLIATAELLQKMISQSDSYENNVLFLLLSGESYDYIGSSRIVYDMKQGIFPVIPDPSVAQPPPIGLHHIGPFIELSQLSRPKPGESLHVHRLNASTETNKLISNLQRYGKHWDILFKDLPPSKNLPPASLQTFLAEKPDIPGIILTEHPMQYTNRYYHSVFDDINNLNFKYANGSQVPDDSIQSFLTNLTNTLANSLFEHVSGKPYPGAALADPALVDELLYCYLEQSNCSLFQSAGNSISPAKPLSYYVGVSHVPTPVPVLSGSALALLTGSPTSYNETYCHNNVSTDQVYQYIWASSKWNDSASPKVCLQTTMNFSAAVSPAFVIEGYDMTSGQYSTWTESVWPELTAKLFIKPSFRQEVMTLSLGITVLVLSFAGVLFIKVRKEILFSPGLPST